MPDNFVMKVDSVAGNSISCVLPIRRLPIIAQL